MKSTMEVKELELSKEALVKLMKLIDAWDPMIRMEYQEIGYTCKLIQDWLDSKGTWMLKTSDENSEEFNIEWTKYLNKDFYNTYKDDNNKDFYINIVVVDKNTNTEDLDNFIKEEELRINNIYSNKVDEMFGGLFKDLF